MWMNEGEIDEALDLVGHHLPEYLPYVRFLSDWRDTVNANSDGWPYWKAGTRCASTLMTLVTRATSSIRGRGDSLPSKKEFDRALTPIRSCATRHKFPAPALRPDGEAAEEPAGMAILNNLAKDMVKHPKGPIQGLGHVILDWIAAGDSPEMIANHMDAVVKDMGDIRDDVHKILAMRKR